METRAAARVLATVALSAVMHAATDMKGAVTAQEIVALYAGMNAATETKTAARVPEIVVAMVVNPAP